MRKNNNKMILKVFVKIKKNHRYFNNFRSNNNNNHNNNNNNNKIANILKILKNRLIVYDLKPKIVHLRINNNKINCKNRKKKYKKF